MYFTGFNYLVEVDIDSFVLLVQGPAVRAMHGKAREWKS